MKKLANLKGAKALNRKEQKSISGGYGECGYIFGQGWVTCPPGAICVGGRCRHVEL